MSPVYADDLVDSVPDGWIIRPFEESVYFQEGPGIRNWQYVEEGVPFVNIRCLVDGRLDRDAMNHVAKNEAFGKYRHFLLEVDDYIVSSSGTLGRLATVRQSDLPCMLNTSVIRMRPRTKGVDRGYLKYFLLSGYYQTQILSFATGSAQLNYGPAHLRQMFIVCPPLPEQRAIAHILGTLDDRIEANRRMAATLEDMARVLFRTWFVNFDPVRAKAAGRWRPGQTLPGLPASLYDAFPNRLVEIEGGEIPEEWRLGVLGDIANLNPEVWTKATRPACINYVDLANTKWGRIETIQHLERDEAPSRAQRVLKPGDTIVGTVRPGNGPFAFVATEGLTGSTGFAQLRPKQDRVAALIYLAATAQENIEALTHLADGAAYPAVRPEVVAATRVIIPSRQAMEAFDTQAAIWLARTSIAEQESRTLATLRESLLPKLVSGAIRVKDSEAFLKARGL